MQIDHKTYQAMLKRMPTESLRYIIADCKAALLAMPDSEKAGYYADEINYCSMELAKRNA